MLGSQFILVFVIFKVGHCPTMPPLSYGPEWVPNLFQWVLWLYLNRKMPSAEELIRILEGFEEDVEEFVPDIESEEEEVCIQI